MVYYYLLYLLIHIFFALYGCDPIIIKYNIIPNDHKSTFILYFSLFNNSGAINNGLPSIVSDINVSFNSFANQNLLILYYLFLYLLIYFEVLITMNYIIIHYIF